MSARTRRLVDGALDAVALLAAALWAGGLVTLGAVVAPLVFAIVHAPASADAMTAVFRRFDSLSIACALVVLLVEVAHAVLRRKLLRVDVARALLEAVAAVLVIVEAMVISPHIVRLHVGGAVRGLGAAGLELEQVHHLAESIAKVELLCLVAVLVLRALRRDASS